MHLRDLDPYSYGLGNEHAVPGTACVGWLEIGTPFPTRAAQGSTFVEQLRTLVLESAVRRARGNHVCTLCCDDRDTYIDGDNGRVLLGAAELWVPTADLKVVFVAPDLIYHYVVDHSYAAPDAFVVAVRDAPATYEHWDPHAESERMVQSVFT